MTYLTHKTIKLYCYRWLISDLKNTLLSVISKFNMLIAPDNEYSAMIKDCNNCNQLFSNSTYNGQMTAKLLRSKNLQGMDYRVITGFISVCGHHESAFELKYHYQLMKSKKGLYQFEFRLAPGTIVGQLDFRVNIDKALRSRSNINQGKPSRLIL